jgi:hypothetical protein
MQNLANGHATPLLKSKMRMHLLPELGLFAAAFEHREWILKPTNCCKMNLANLGIEASMNL